MGASFLLASRQTFVAQPSEVILPDQSPDPGRNRIVCIGGSAVRGTGSFGPELQSWPSLMARFLFFHGLEYEVKNAGANSEGTIAIANRIDSLLDDKDALIILDTGENDIDLINKRYMAQFTQMYIDLGRENKVPVIDCMPPGLFFSLGVRGPDGKHFNEIAYRQIAAYILHRLNPAFNPTVDELTVSNQTVIDVPWIQYVLEHPGQLGD